jgi:hypothetical protein
MANLAVTNEFEADTDAIAADVNQNFTDIVDYVNNRNTGAASWDSVKSVGAVYISPTSNQLVLGATRTVTITAPTPATESRIHTIPDVSADSEFVMLAGAQTLTGVKTFDTTPKLKGVVTADPTAAGYIGEIISSEVTAASAVSMRGSGSVTNLTTITLTAGHWRIHAGVAYTPNGATVTTAGAYVSKYSEDTSTDHFFGKNVAFLTIGPTASNSLSAAVPSHSLTLTETTIVYLKARQEYTVATPKAYGFIEAVRER